MKLIRLLLTTALVFITVTHALTGESDPMHIAFWAAAIYASTMLEIQGFIVDLRESQK